MCANTLVSALLFGLLATVAYAAVSHGDYSDPEHPGKCVIKPDVIVGPGMNQYPGECARIECNESGHAEIATCGVELAAPGCKLGKQLKPDADYPECCQHEVICE